MNAVNVLYNCYTFMQCWNENPKALYINLADQKNILYDVYSISKELSRGRIQDFHLGGTTIDQSLKGRLLRPL